MSFDMMPGWFVEAKPNLWPGQAMSLEVDEMLFSGQSPYQKVDVFKNKTFGHVLVIDGCIQITDLDEIAYQEPIAHIPLFAHPNPKRVLVVGGGDGAVISQIVKHDCVEEVVICEIDEMVIDCARKYFPHFAKTYDHPKVTLNLGDAAEYIKNHDNYFDVIIADTSDPDGPAEALFKSPFYQDLYQALRAGGKVATQGETYWKDEALITGLIKDLKANTKFEKVEYATTQIPTYPCGTIGFILCSKALDEANTKFEKVEYATTQIPTYPCGTIGFILCSKALDEANPDSTTTMRKIAREIPADFDTKFYDADMHEAAFASIPKYFKDILKKL